MKSKVLVCIPTKGNCRIELAALCAIWKQQYRSRLEIFNTSSTPISVARNDGVDAMYELGMDHILFIDADMIIPPTALEQLLGYNKSIVSALYNCVTISPNLTIQSHPNAYIKLEDDDIPKDNKYPVEKYQGFYMPLTIQDIQQRKLKSNLTPVDGVGCGCLLINKRVFDRMEFPFFYGPLAEDLYFCAKAKELDYDIFVDPTLQVQHYKTVPV